MFKVPKKVLVDSFEYEEYMGEDDLQNVIYAEPVTVSFVRIDRTPEFSRDVSETKLVSNATIYAYKQHTVNFTDFKLLSRVKYDGVTSIIKSASSYEHPYKKEPWSYELKVL
ncbi:minor capsid protein [Listeria monocytogenes]|nr:minor capsid protein [Listeria monocytogenes]EAF3625773.1 minor capsid protein [Listeria monocytogenes]EAF4063402.1 minor capsid protein [Listeria monocytogenes]EKA5785950.1 minor capsid protein [Listeria monocytogenes]EKZ4888704.1 minor capsid protein [Listeria monocytogenes]